MNDKFKYEIVRCSVQELNAFEMACTTLLIQGWRPAGGIVIHEGFILQAWINRGV